MIALPVTMIALPARAGGGTASVAAEGGGHSFRRRWRNPLLRRWLGAAVAAAAGSSA